MKINLNENNKMNEIRSNKRNKFNKSIEIKLYSNNIYNNKINTSNSFSFLSSTQNNISLSNDNNNNNENEKDSIEIIKKEYYFGEIKKLNHIDINSIPNKNKLDLILNNQIKDILIEPSLNKENKDEQNEIKDSYENEENQSLCLNILYINLMDGPVGMDLTPVRDDGLICGGLKVIEIFNKNIGFEINDIILSINDIKLESLSISKAIEIFQNSTNRVVTVLRSNSENTITIENLSQIYGISNYDNNDSDNNDNDRNDNNSNDNYSYNSKDDNQFEIQSEVQFQTSQDYLRNINQQILINNSKLKKYDPRYSIPYYRGYISDVNKRMSSRPTFDYVPILDSKKNKKII